MLSSTTCDSAWISAKSSDLHPFHGTFVYEDSGVKRGYKGSFWPLGIELAGLCTKKVGFVSGSHSVDGTQILKHYTSCWLISVAMWSQSWVYSHWLAGISGSNLIWMFVSCECFVLSGKRSLWLADHFSWGVLPSVVCLNKCDLGIIEAA